MHWLARWILVRLKWLSFAAALLCVVLMFQGSNGAVVIGGFMLLLAIFLSLETRKP